MNLEARKITFIQEFLKLQNEDTINDLEQLMKKSKAQAAPKPMTMKSFNERIDKSMQDSKTGNFVEDRDLKSIIDKWD